MDEKFVAGDVVRLKSGSPKMTVLSENTRKNSSWTTTIDVCWFVEGAPSPAFSSFPIEALMLEEPRKAQPSAIDAEVPGGSRRRRSRS